MDFNNRNLPPGEGADPRRFEEPREPAVGSRSIGLAPQLGKAESLAPDLDAAVGFLESWKPGGPWIVGAGGDGSMECREFADPEPMKAWIAEQQAQRRNCYFQANDCRLGDAMSRGKPSREDVLRATCVHVDIDPREDPYGKPQPIEKAQAEIVERFDWRGDPAEYQKMPVPTVTIMSGGGYQPLWKLDVPEEFASGVTGEQQRHEFERYNKQLAGQFGGDNCHAVNQLLRLPGTVNFPSDVKRARNPGRDDALAHVVDEWSSWESYPLDEFVQALPEKEKGGKPKKGRAAVDIGNVRRIPPERLLEELSPFGIDDENSVLGRIIHGHDPDAHPSDRDRTRSGAMFGVACELVRHKVPDEIVFSLLTDPNYGISKHALSKGRGCSRAAVRAITEAKARWGGPLGDPIDVTDGRQGKALQEVGEQIAALNLFERSGDLVRPIRLAEPDDEGEVKRARGALIVERMTAYALNPVMSRACRFVKHDARSKKPRYTDPTIDFTKKFLGDRESWKFRVLAGVTGAPVFTAEGEVVTEPGHDPATGLWLDTETLELPPIPDRPTKDDALAAYETLMHPFRGYPIPDPECRSVLAAAMIAPVVTPTVDSVPIIGITSTSPGFGKTKIQQCIGIMATGTEPAFMSWAEKDEENDKRLDSCLLAGDPVIGIDNVTRPIGGDVLCSIVSNAAHKPRVLCKSHMPVMSSRVQVTVNGNNLAFMLDVCRRALLIVIDDPDEEHPERRPFDFDPVDEVRERRGELLAAALTILLAWHCDGRTDPEGFEPLGLSAGWEQVRKALLWLGKADPAKTQKKIHADDPEREHRREMLDLLWQARGPGEFMAADLQHELIADGKLTQLGTMMLDGPNWNPRKVGNKLRQLAGRWIDGVRLVKVRAPKNRGHVYRVHRKDGEPEPDEPF